MRKRINNSFLVSFFASVIVAILAIAIDNAIFNVLYLVWGAFFIMVIIDAFIGYLEDESD